MKIDEFLELADYDWIATNVNKKESPYLLELVDYITSVIASALSNLPAQLKGYIYFGAFDHLANSLSVRCTLFPFCFTLKASRNLH